ncbi:MAG: hypothetical protein M3Y05_13685 [Gemmatimonadota bacterium]|nr:hypothetical protein [Gemmatimonadota bacterium]
MPHDSREPPAGGSRAGFSASTFLRALLPALAATAIVVFLATRDWKTAEKPRADGMMRVTLSQKDAAFRPIQPAKGGASGEVIFKPAGPALHFVMHGSAIPAGLRYALELQVDNAIYSVANVVPDEHGAIAIDTTLTRFAEGICVGRNYDAPRPVLGRHAIKFWIKRDGSPSSGTMPGVAPSAPGAQLACHGNGDGNYSYVLLDNGSVNFTGTAQAAHDSP